MSRISVLHRTDVTRSNHHGGVLSIQKEIKGKAPTRDVRSCSKGREGEKEGARELTTRSQVHMHSPHTKWASIMQAHARTYAQGKKGDVDVLGWLAGGELQARALALWWQWLYH